MIKVLVLGLALVCLNGNAVKEFIKFDHFVFSENKTIFFTEELHFISQCRSSPKYSLSRNSKPYHQTDFSSFVVSPDFREFSLYIFGVDYNFSNLMLPTWNIRNAVNGYIQAYGYISPINAAQNFNDVKDRRGVTSVEAPNAYFESAAKIFLNIKAVKKTDINSIYRNVSARLLLTNLSGCTQSAKKQDYTVNANDKCSSRKQRHEPLRKTIAKPHPNYVIGPVYFGLLCVVWFFGSICWMIYTALKFVGGNINNNARFFFWFGSGIAGMFILFVILCGVPALIINGSLP